MKPIVLLLALGLPALGATTAASQFPAVPPSSIEGPAGKALELFNSGHHQAAIDAARPLAEQGNPDALFLLGYAAETGQGTEASREGALEFYRQATAEGHREATLRRALILLNSPEDASRQLGREALETAAENDPAMAGRILGEAWLRGLLGETPDFDRAVEWWGRAGEAGDNASLLLLARLHSGDFGFPDKVDAARGLDYYRQAATRGEPAAYIPLGSRLLNGPQETRDEAEGRKWLAKATEGGQAMAYLALGDYEEHAKQDLPAAVESYREGARSGHPECMLRLASMLYLGRGTDKDEAAGRDWLDQAAATGLPAACLERARLLSQDEEPEAAAIYTDLLRAANGGLADAQNELGLVYLSGRLGAADAAAAVAWFTRAAKAGHPPAQHHLGRLYERGLGVPVNLSNAADLYSRAAKQGHPNATSALARFHALGIGTEPDLAKAWALASLAVERGDEAAKSLVDEIFAKLSADQFVEAQAELERLKSEPR